MTSPAFLTAGSVSGRFREWTLTLAPTHEDRDQAKGRRFTPDLAIIRISAHSEDAPYTAMSVALCGNGRKKRLSSRYSNDTANPALSILTAPAWVRDLFAAATGAGHLINTYAGPALGARFYAENTTPDERFPVVAELQEAA